MQNMEKNKIMKISTIAVFIVLLLSSCTIQKRVHMKGFLVEWNKSVSYKKTSFKSEDITNDTDLFHSTKKQRSK